MANPTTGKDIVLDLRANGVSVFEEAVQSYNVKAVVSTVRTEHLGTTRPTVDKIPAGFEGQFVLSTRDDRFEAAYELYLQAKETNSLFVWTLVTTETLRDPALAPVTLIYAGMELEADTSHEPGRATTTTVAFAAETRVRS